MCPRTETLSFKKYLLYVIATVMVCTGCERGFPTVEGVVSLDGAPLAVGQEVSATIGFYPQDGRGSPATGRIRQDGRYVISTGGRTGLPAGEYAISVRASEFLPNRDPSTPRSSRLITPRHYSNPGTSGLSATVTLGSNQIDFDLSSERM